jgi:cardiolipin synthase
MLYLFITLYIISLSLIPVVIMTKKKPVTTVAYMLGILFLPVIGALVFLIFGTERILNKGRLKLFSNEALRSKLRHIESEWKPCLFDDSKQKVPIKLESILRLSRKFGLFNAVAGNQVEILVDADETYHRMEKAILKAKHHINLEFYIFRTDEVGERFLNLLVEKAKQGIQVNLIYDSLGSLSLGWNRSFLTRFRQAGVKVRDFLPLRTFIKPWNLNLRNHRKIIVVDNNIGFTGSLNIGKDFLSMVNKKKIKWRETQVMIKGPAVTQLQWIFCEDWYFSTGEELFKSEYFLPAQNEGQDVLQVVPSGPDIREKAAYKVFLLAIFQAQKSILLTTPYFIPDRPLNLALQLAALRGVDVKILVPRESDHKFITLAGRSYYGELLQNKVQIFEYLPGCHHAKMLIIDGYFSIIGTTNFDVHSFDYNFELNIQIYGEQFAQKTEKLFYKDLEDSRELDMKTFQSRPVYQKFKENTCRLFSPIL